MEVREYRKLDDVARIFTGAYAFRKDRYTSAEARIASYFAGINTMNKEEFIRVMNGAGKALLKMGVDCRTDAERIRHQLHQIQNGQVPVGDKPL